MTPPVRLATALRHQAQGITESRPISMTSSPASTITTSSYCQGSATRSEETAIPSTSLIISSSENPGLAHRRVRRAGPAGPAGHPAHRRGRAGASRRAETGEARPHRRPGRPDPAGQLRPGAGPGPGTGSQDGPPQARRARGRGQGRRPAVGHRPSPRAIPAGHARAHVHRRARPRLLRGPRRAEDAPRTAEVPQPGNGGNLGHRQLRGPAAGRDRRAVGLASRPDQDPAARLARHHRPRHQAGAVLRPGRLVARPVRATCSPTARPRPAGTSPRCPRTRSPPCPGPATTAAPASGTWPNPASSCPSPAGSTREMSSRCGRSPAATRAGRCTS
jgi:hypothetical protein